MKNKFFKVLVAGLLVVSVASFSIGMFTQSSVFASEVTTEIKTGTNAAAQNSKTPNSLFTGDDAVFKIIANTALFIIGAVSILMLIYGGIRYTVSGGDEKAVTAAKNTIIYSVIGVVVAILAYAIVNYVIGVLFVPYTAPVSSQTDASTDETSADTTELDDTELPYVSPEGVAVLTYDVVNALTEQFTKQPAPEVLLPSYGPSTDVVPMPELTPSEGTDSQPLTPTERIATINTANSTISELTAEANSLAAEGKSSNSAQKQRNADMISVAKKEENRTDTAETGENTGPRIKEYQAYTNCGGAWCASFVSWVHHEATDNNNVRNCGVKQLIDSTPSSRLKEYGQPKPGDILLWYGYIENTVDWKHIRGHTGILIEILGNGKYKTIEGNTTNKDGSPSRVRFWTRPASYWRLANNPENQGVNTEIVHKFITP
jgi:hypothetical protein